MTVWIWLGFLAVIATLIALDLGVFHRKAHAPTMGEALGWTLFWVFLALGFNVLVYFLYESNGLDGAGAALQFFAGYLIEKSLSLDNIFVIALIFAHYNVPLAYQHRTLAWGVIGAILMRMVLILLGTTLILKFHWILYLFGVFLIYTAVKMLLEPPSIFDPERHLLVRLTRKALPITRHFVDDHFFTRHQGVLAATPLFLALVEIEFTDLVFAVDSIPAIFAVTLDPFIVFTSNIFAILGLRALYFALAGLIDKFRYLKLSLVLVLLFVGIKMLVSYFYPIPILASVLVIMGILLAGVLFSVLTPPTEKKALPAPLAHDLQELAMFTWAQGSRIVILVFGITILLLGLAMIVLPGPAMIFIPIGLAILAREFVWARRLLKTLKEKGSRLFSNHKTP